MCGRSIPREGTALADVESSKAKYVRCRYQGSFSMLFLVHLYTIFLKGYERGH